MEDLTNEKIIKNIDEFDNFINSNRGVVLYLSTPECSVCKVLKPKLKELLADNFPEMKFAFVDISESRELAAQNNVFTAPTILFFFEEKELMRKSRSISLQQLGNELQRPYSIIFG